MQPLTQSIWTFPKGCTPSGLHSALKEHFATQATPGKGFTRRWFDTFDWILFHRNQLLTCEGDIWCLQDFQGQPLHSLHHNGKGPLFHHQFPESSLQRTLEESCSIRALIEYGDESIHSSGIQILNDDEKIVAIIELQESQIPGSQPPLLSARLREVRGYSKWCGAVEEIFNDLEGQRQNSITFSLQRILHHSGREALDYSSGYNIPLRPEMTGIEAVSHIYRSLLADIHCNEDGVIDDIDTEFLHDLRVAVRRTRSGLTLVKDVLATEDSEHFKKGFRLLGKKTGAVRDLDVYLLSEKYYKSFLPERLQEGIGYFFEDLAGRRKVERKKLVRFLRSTTCTRILKDWEQFLVADAHPAWGKKSALPIIGISGKIIRRHFKRVLKNGGRIHRDTADTELHRLRIQCKKLRYSLEFFSSLYDKKQMKRLLKQLKKLQNNLGDFNDLSVQQEMLSKYLTTLRPGSNTSRETAAAVGGLLTALSRQHAEVRSHFEETFSGFSCQENLTVYNTLFPRS